MRLISPEGEQLGIVDIQDALAKARETGQDLVEVSSDSDPPVCRILDYGKFRYGSKRKEPGPKGRKQHFGQIKELRMRPKIDKHDLERKMAKAGELLEEGYRLQLTCMFRGREMTHLELGRQLLNRAAEMLAGVSKLERPLNREGRRMNIMLMPKIEVVRAKAKEHEEQARKHAEEAESRRKKSKRRHSTRRKPVDVSGGEQIESEIEVPAGAAQGAGGDEPEGPEGGDAQAENSQGTEEEG